MLIHPDLYACLTLAYEPIGLRCTNIIIEPESKEYGACTFEVNDKKIKFRVAKITPKKSGLFVTFWKRMGKGPIMPYDISDDFDYLIISIRTDKNFGQFVFRKSLLLEKGIISQHGKGGKRAIRVYPPWESAPSNQSRKTQNWQQMYFFTIEPQVETTQAKRLLF